MNSLHRLALVGATIATICLPNNFAQARIVSLDDLPRVEVKTVGNPKTPWSRPIVVYDSFTGKSVPVVVDKNYQNYSMLGSTQDGIITIWALSGIKVMYYYRNPSGIAGGLLKDGLQVKVNDNIYNLSVDANSKYPMSPELYQALMQSTGKVMIRAFHNGKQYDSEIGRKTIEAYQELGEFFSRQQ